MPSRLLRRPELCWLRSLCYPTLQGRAAISERIWVFTSGAAMLPTYKYLKNVPESEEKLNHCIQICL